MSKDEPESSRRRFLTGASASAIAAAAMLSGTSTNAANLRDVLRAEMHTPITDFLGSDSAKKLTPAAAKLTKGELLQMRQYHRHGRGKPVKISSHDIVSVENAFDDHELAQASRQGFKLAGMSALGVSQAAAGDITACCCCCPCCSTAAAVTRPAATL